MALVQAKACFGFLIDMLDITQRWVLQLIVIWIRTFSSGGSSTH